MKRMKFRNTVLVASGLALFGLHAAAQEKKEAPPLPKHSPKTTNPQNPDAPISPGKENVGEPNVGATPAPGTSMKNETIVRPSTKEGEAMKPGGPTMGTGNKDTEFQRATSIEIRFSEGATELSEEAKRKLSETLHTARQRGRIEEVRVLSWGDVPYPAKGEKAPRQEQELAEQRSRQVEEFIKEEFSELEIETYTMTNRPSALEDLFNTTEARMKDKLEEAGISGKGSQGGSRAIVMVVLD